ncbi:MAG: CDP-alcohol phosphatidyltransferase family protein [Actinomycetota bacterium]|nr:CDP-alcohol phosphatidyltransferase family protein [Actinomycetota bacterium]
MPAPVIRQAALERVRDGYTAGVRRVAARTVTGLARTRLSPDALTAAGVLLCATAAVLVYFEYRNELLFYYLGSAVFVVGSILDILDGALARRSGRGTRFGAFLDSTTDRIGEAFVLGAIGLVFARHGNEVALAFTFAAATGSFLVSYTRARAEALGLAGDVGVGSRAERVVVISVGLALAPWGLLPWAIYLLTGTAWLTVLQRVAHVRTQLGRGDQIHSTSASTEELASSLSDDDETEGSSRPDAGRAEAAVDRGGRAAP